MAINLEGVLLIGTLISGLLWLSGKWRDKSTQKSKQLPLYADFAKSFFQVFVFVFIVRSFIIEPFRIPSGSMLPTLEIGDFIVVKKYSYGLRLPLLHKKVLPLGSPQRGDVIVFRFPEEPQKNYIKRVVGLPGDVIDYRTKTLTINGQAVVSQKIGPYEPQQRSFDELGADVYSETLLGVTHRILNNAGRDNSRGDGTYTVPDGHYFVMGDNREQSYDSRFWGFVPEENLLGKAGLIWMNWDFERKKGAFNRIGTIIK